MNLVFGHIVLKWTRFVVWKEYGNETIQLYADENRKVQKVGAGLAMFSGNELLTTLKFRLYKQRSNNQAEQLAKDKILESL